MLLPASVFLIFFVLFGIVFFAASSFVYFCACTRVSESASVLIVARDTVNFRLAFISFLFVSSHGKSGWDDGVVW